MLNRDLIFNTSIKIPVVTALLYLTSLDFKISTNKKRLPALRQPFFTIINANTIFLTFLSHSEAPVWRPDVY